MNTITAWLVALMTSLSPPDRGAAAGSYVPDARETAEARLERYRGIAAAVATVAFDPGEPPAFSGSAGRHATATLLLGLSWMESGWRRDVDLGLGKEARGSGMDSCLMQIRLGRGEKTSEGWDWKDLVADREKCFRAGLRIVRRSMGACWRLPLEHRLSAYATGSCGSKIGHQKSAQRMAVGRMLFGRLPLPKVSVPLANNTHSEARMVKRIAGITESIEDYALGDVDDDDGALERLDAELDRRVGLATVEEYLSTFDGDRRLVRSVRGVRGGDDVAHQSNVLNLMARQESLVIRRIVRSVAPSRAKRAAAHILDAWHFSKGIARLRSEVLYRLDWGGPSFDYEGAAERFVAGLDLHQMWSIFQGGIASTSYEEELELMPGLAMAITREIRRRSYREGV